MKEKWDAPTPIQSVTWPQALAGKDVVGIAQTGSGKTLGVSLSVCHTICSRTLGVSLHLSVTQFVAEHYM